MKIWLIVSIVALCTAGCAQTSFESNANTGDRSIPNFLLPIDLLPKVTGSLSWKITTNSEIAQSYFDQGLQLRYAYGVNEAARSFREAQRADPNCAMCYWGEAYALGSFLNGAISLEKAPYAFTAIQRAAELIGDNVTQMEKDLIAASLVRYPDDYIPAMKPELDQLFADAMREVYEKYPDDLNVIAIYASAIFLLEPRRGIREMDDPDVIRLHAVLQDGLMQDIRHPGLCHLFIHATESTVRPDLAEPCAEYLGSSIPGASHINHMPSHTWNEVGRWNDSVRANTVAWHSDQKVAIGEGVPIYPQHNLHMLLYAASYGGQGAAAIQAGKDYAKLTGNSMYHALTLIRFGRFDEVSALNRPTARSRLDNVPFDVTSALWDFAFGYSQLRAGDIDFATTIVNDLFETARVTESRFRFHRGGLIVGTVANILAGEIQRAQGNLGAAIETLLIAADVEDQIGYDEPEPLPFAARHWLGAALMEAGRYMEAEETYREELEDHPQNVWSLRGLLAALVAQDKSVETVEADFAASMIHADTWIVQSRF
ncbi:MAG: tetratricopeptide repeat protein [Candidatus Rariloculaceae bacterium]